MATSRQRSVQDRIADVTECSICTELYESPKILPCVHTFCLRCLDKYGRDKKAGDQMACPLCRNEFLIPDGGFGRLPNNFFIDKMIEIRKLSEASTSETFCAACPEEERIKAEMFCFDCDQNLCKRCGIAHRKMKVSQNHQVVEIGKKLNPEEVTLRNSYCHQHPQELVKMYCEDDEATICFLCFAESHHTHKCLSVTKASEEFSNAMERDLKMVRGKLTEFKAYFEQLDKWKNELLSQIADAEEQISNEESRLKALIETHSTALIQKLILLKDGKLKKIESAKEEVERFQVIIESYVKYSEELLSKGAPDDICREADHQKVKARELASLSTNLCAHDFNGDGVTFNYLNLDDVLSRNNIVNVIGDVKAGSANCHLVSTVTDDAMQFIQRHPELQMIIEDSLQKLNCHISWPSEGKGEVKLKFKGKENKKPIAGWDGECDKVLQRFAGELTWKKEDVLQEIWSDFKQKIQEYSANMAKLIDIAFENDQCEIQYIGLKKDTDEFEKTFKKIKGELEEELERKKKRISETISNLKSHQLSLIRTKEFQKKLKQEFPNVGFEIKTTEVNFCGVPDAVKKAKLFLYEKVTAAVQDSFEISESLSKLYAKDEAKSYLMQQVLSKGISASWMCNDRSVVVFALDDKNAKEAIEVLKEEVVEEYIQLSEASEALVQSIQWKSFIASLYSDSKSLEVTVMSPTVIAACTRNVVEEVRKRLNGFIEKHAIFEKFLPMELGVVDVITKFLKEDFRKIVAELKECSGNIDTSIGEPGFIINGNEAGVRKAVEDLHKLTYLIVPYDHVIDQPGIPAYFYGMPGTEVLRGIQLNRKVSIQLDNSQEQLEPQAKANDGSERCRVEVRPGKFMILIRGDITKFKVDAIVNATNEELKHYGGVAAAIAEAAGTELEVDCIERVKWQGKLLPGQACVTKAGKLPCKKVIHAVGPRWSGGNKEEGNILHMAVESSLTKADEESLRSVAMPSISTGIFGFPLDKATDIIVDAVKSYFVDNYLTTVQKVFFIDNDSRAVASLEKKLRTIQAKGSPHHPEGRNEGGRGRRMVAGLRGRLIPTREAPATCSITQGNYKLGVMQTPIAMVDARMQIQEQHEQRRPQHLSRIIMSICALSKKSIDDVLKDIEDIIKDYIIGKVLESPQDQESIAKLDPEQVERIKRMSEIYPVQIEVETGRLKRIRIRGPPMEVTLVIDQVHSIYQEAHKKEIMKMEDEWIATVAQWKLEDFLDSET